MPTDVIRLVHDSLTGVEAITARFAAHAYDLHRHADWLVGVTEDGVQDFLCRGARQRSTPGRVILIEPQEAHDGQAGTEHGFAYRMLYLPRPYLAAALSDPPETSLGFRTTLSDDPRLGAAIRSTCTALASPPITRLAKDAALDEVTRLLRPHLGRPQRQSGPRDPLIARRARDRLHADPADNIGADALASASGATDRFRLARAFRAAYGTSPHAYLVQIRLLHARNLLSAGEPPASVAAACGFADQSHLGRWFRRAYGISPAAYRKLCTNIPDTPGRSPLH